MIGSDFTGLQARMRAQQGGGLSPPALPKATEGKSDARRAAEGFETFFLRQIMADMRKTSLGEDIFGSAGTRNFQEMQDAKLAESISESGGFGIADQMARLKREDMFDIVERQRRFRIERVRNFPEDYFGDPAWDIFLDLMKADCDGEGLPATHLGLDADIPLSTVLRYVKRMENDGYVTRETDRADNRRSIIRLTEKARERLRRVIDAATVYEDEAYMPGQAPMMDGRPVPSAEERPHL